MKSSIVLMEDNPLPIVQFWILFIDCCFLIGSVKNDPYLNSIYDFAGGVHNIQCFPSLPDTEHHFLQMQTGF